MLKEADLRVGFTRACTSVASREVLDPEIVQRRLLLCVYGMGTNTGLKQQGIDDALIQPYSGHASRQSLEVYSRLAIGAAQAEYNSVIGRFPV